MILNTTAPEQADLLFTVQEWIKQKKPGVTDLTLELDLIESRIVDSLDFLELIFLLEEITGREFDLNNLSIDSFRSLKAIQENFLGCS